MLKSIMKSSKIRALMHTPYEFQFDQFKSVE